LKATPKRREFRKLLPASESALSLDEEGREGGREEGGKRKEGARVEGNGGREGRRKERRREEREGGREGGATVPGR
jgi:hypothetical protein